MHIFHSWDVLNSVGKPSSWRHLNFNPLTLSQLFSSCWRFLAEFQNYLEFWYQNYNIFLIAKPFDKSLSDWIIQIGLNYLFWECLAKRSLGDQSNIYIFYFLFVPSTRSSLRYDAPLQVRDRQLLQLLSVWTETINCEMLKCSNALGAKKNKTKERSKNLQTN